MVEPQTGAYATPQALDPPSKWGANPPLHGVRSREAVKMPMETVGHAAALWVGLHLLLLLVLSTLVVRQRQKHKVALGDDGIPELVQAIRAHTNAVEYIPAALIGLVVLEVAGAPGALVHIAGLVLLAGRLSHAVGLSNSGGTSILRTLGMVLTWLAYVFIIASCLFFAIG